MYRVEIPLSKPARLEPYDETTVYKAIEIAGYDDVGHFVHYINIDNFGYVEEDMEDHGRAQDWQTGIMGATIKTGVISTPSRKRYEITITIDAANAVEALSLVNTAKEIRIKEVVPNNPWTTTIQNC